HNQDFHFRVWKFARYVDSDLVRFEHVVPAGTAAADTEILRLDARRDRGWWHGQMSKGHPRECPFDQLADKGRGANLNQLGSARHQLGLTHTCVNRENPSRAAEAALVGNFAFPVIVARGPERNGDDVGRNDGFEMQTDVALEFLETAGKVAVIVFGEIPRM